MIFGNINSNENVSVYPKSIQKALEYVKKTDLINLEPGVYEIEGKDIYAQVFDAVTEERSEKRPEVHQSYVDVQFLASGEERIGFYPDMGDNVIDEELLEEKDIIFYQNNVKLSESIINMQPGCYAVFFPSDVHVPGICVKNPATNRKVVVKVKMDTILQEYKKRSL